MFLSANASRLWSRVGAAAAAATTTAYLGSSHRPPSSLVVQCEADPTANTESLLLHKRQTIRQAVEGTLKRQNTQQSLGRLRSIQDALLKRWQQDEDGWSDLPARAWPAYQPNEEQLQGIQSQIQKLGCNIDTNSKSDPCRTLLFDRSVSNVFYSIDPKAGLEHFEQMAKQGDMDAMVACGVVLVEGIGGTKTDEQKAIEWLKQAVQRGSPQACYELGVIYYTGIDGVVEENSAKAFELFQKAADAANHTAALYMMADQLLEGEGCQKSVSRAIPLLERAADQGHRFARQRIRELLRRRYTATDGAGGR